MNAFPWPPTGANTPLRRPSTGPCGVPGVRPLAVNLTGEDAGAMVKADISLMGSSLSGIIPNMCNYCSKQGRFFCKGCMETVYCSAPCANDDWKAHMHVCLMSKSKPEGEKAKENRSLPVVNGPSQTQTQPEPQVPTPFPVSASDASVGPSVYLVDLEKNQMAIGSEVEALVVELHSPGRFFVRVHPAQDALQTVSMELQKTYSGSLPATNNNTTTTTYLPSQGEVCAVQFSMDMNWYRGLVQSVPTDEKTASILYIDFGNEEDVPVARIRRLAPNIQLVPPCATECGVAGLVPALGMWTGECCLAVKQLFVGRVVTLSVVDVVHGDRVHLVDFMDSATGKRLSTFLVDQGYAKPKDIAKITENDLIYLVSAENFKSLSTGKDENTEARLPEPLTQGVGDHFSILVTHVHSPVHIICQKVENASVIQELQINLRDHCSEIPASLNFRPAPGTVCCSQFSDDNQWYRAQVLAYSSVDRVCVGYIDFGNSEEVELGCLRPLSAPLLALPMQAFPCALAGVQPVMEGCGGDKCMSILQQMVCNRILSVRIAGCSEGKALVVMNDEFSDPQDVAEFLLSMGLADPAPAATAGPAPHQEAEDTASATAGPAPDQEAEDTASATAAPGGAAKVESEKAPDPLVWSSAELVCGGPWVELMVSSVQNPGEFYCYNHASEEYHRLVELGSELKQHCEGEASPCQATVGQPCCALFPDDMCWYRALVREVSEHQVLVFFVDYGNTAAVQKIHLRNITAPLLTLPFQAIRCWLAGVEPLGAAWPGEALYFFRTGPQLSALVLGLTERGYAVELVSDGRRVAPELLARHLARPSVDTVAAHLTPPAPVVPVVVHTISPATAAREPEPKVQEETKVVEPMAPVSMALVSMAPVQEKTTESPHEKAPEPTTAESGPSCLADTKTTGPEGSVCSCKELKTKVDHLEGRIREMIELLICALKYS